MSTDRNCDRRCYFERQNFSWAFPALRTSASTLCPDLFIGRTWPMIEWLQSTASPSQIWTLLSTLVGVVAGFSLNATWQGLTRWYKNRRLKNALYDELDTLLHQIAHKKDLARKMRSALSEGGILSGDAVPCASVIYDNHFDSISKHLDALERDNIHNIYTRLKQSDHFLSNFERLMIEDLEGEAVDDPWKAYTGKLGNIIEDYETAQALIEKVLADEPEDIYQRRSEVPRSIRRFRGKATADVIRDDQSGA